MPVPNFQEIAFVPIAGKYVIPVIATIHDVVISSDIGYSFSSHAHIIL
jgi:hypothetical protein